MGKSFHHYMGKKDFHPYSRSNIKQVWMRQQKLQHEQKLQEETMKQYKKQADMHETKAKVGLSFMYDLSPGLKKNKKEGNQEYKFQWENMLLVKHG